MKKIIVGLALLVMIGTGSAIVVRAQGTSKGPDPSLTRDKTLEQEAAHNLEVAQQYFKLKKAYRASLARCEETITAYPAFSRFVEILYIAGMSSYYLSEGQGKQKPLPSQTPDKLRDDARIYLSQVVNSYPDSSFKDEADRTLKLLGGPLKKP